jgi:hypothetical protein
LINVVVISVKPRLFGGAFLLVRPAERTYSGMPLARPARRSISRAPWPPLTMPSRNCASRKYSGSGSRMKNIEKTAGDASQESRFAESSGADPGALESTAGKKAGHYLVYRYLGGGGFGTESTGFAARVNCLSRKGPLMRDDGKNASPGPACLVREL